MWGIFVGLGLGLFQMYLLKKITVLIGSAAKRNVFIPVLMILLKLAFIMFILYLVATVSIAHLLWTAGGMLVTILASSVVYFIRKNARFANKRGR